MGDQLEFIVTNVAKSVVNATSSCCKNIIVITIIFFVILSAAKFFWLNKYCLPEFTFRQNPKSKGNKHENPYCTVCLYEVANGEKFRRLHECKHCFHVECIDAWFQSSSTCPLCRSEIALVLRRRNQQRSLLSLFLSMLQNIVRIMDKFDLNSQSSFATGGTINLQF